MHSSLALIIIAVIPSFCQGLDEQSCRVSTESECFEVGSDIQIACACATGTKIYWMLDKVFLNESLSKAVNASYTVLSLKNFTRRSATVECLRADHQVLAGTFIRTYSKPSNISCVMSYKSLSEQQTVELFTCSWEHQVDSSADIEYTLLGHYPLIESKMEEICKTRQTTCTVDYDNIDHIIPIPNYSVVMVRASACEALSDPYKFYPKNIVKVLPPEFKVTSSSDHLLVEWHMGNYHETQRRCEVRYSKVDGRGGPVNVLNVTLNKYEENGALLTGTVESCSNYTLAIRCALDRAPWSDWSQETVYLTKLHRSDVKLSLWRTISGAGENGLRKVHIMWTEMPPTCQDAFTFTISRTPIAAVNYTDSVCGSTNCDVDVDQDARRINLSVLRDNVLFAEDSVYVPGIGESLPEVLDLQPSSLEGNIQINWKAPVQPVRGYMIDYTHDGENYYWEETEFTNATLSDLVDKTAYNITVTPLFNNKTGHGVQALHICSSLGDPGEVTVTSIQAKDRSVVISWTLKSRKACSGAVVNYTIVYSTLTGPHFNVTRDSTKQDFLLENLTPDTRYSIYVVASALTGTTESNKTFFKTKRFDPMLSTILAVSGGIAILLVLSLGLYCAVRWKKFKERPVPNPSHSSVALWPSTRQEKPSCPFQPFHNPTESLCDRIYTEDLERTSTSTLATECNDLTASDPTEQYAQPASFPAQKKLIKNPAQPVQTQQASSSGETTELLSSKESPSSPYLSQSPVETPTHRAGKQSKRVPVKQQEKTTPLTVYVTLDMFDQGQGR